MWICGINYEVKHVNILDSTWNGAVANRHDIAWWHLKMSFIEYISNSQLSDSQLLKLAEAQDVEAEPRWERRERKKTYITTYSAECTFRDMFV